jgi:hypothetical protein
VQGEADFGLHPQPLGTAVLEISTPPHTFPEPMNAGKKSLFIPQSLLLPGPVLQLFTPLKSQHSDPPESQKPQLQSMHMRVGKVWQYVLSGHASQGFPGTVQVQSGFIIVPSAH